MLMECRCSLEGTGVARRALKVSIVSACGTAVGTEVLYRLRVRLCDAQRFNIRIAWMWLCSVGAASAVSQHAQGQGKDI